MRSLPLLRSAVIALGAGGGLTWGCLLLDATPAAAQPLTVLPVLAPSACHAYCGHAHPLAGGAHPSAVEHRAAHAGRVTPGRRRPSPPTTARAPARRSAATAPKGTAGGDAHRAGGQAVVIQSTGRRSSVTQMTVTQMTVTPMTVTQSTVTQSTGGPPAATQMTVTQPAAGPPSGHVASTSTQATPSSAAHGSGRGSRRGGGRRVSAMSTSTSTAPKGSGRPTAGRAVAAGGPGSGVPAGSGVVAVITGGAGAPSAALRQAGQLLAPFTQVTAGAFLPGGSLRLPGMPPLPSVAKAVPVGAWALNPFDLPSGMLPHGFGGQTLRRAAKLKVPIALMVAMGLFLLAQDLIDRRDPKVARAPERPGEDSVAFE